MMLEMLEVLFSSYFLLSTQTVDSCLKREKECPQHTFVALRKDGLMKSRVKKSAGKPKSIPRPKTLTFTTLGEAIAYDVTLKMTKQQAAGLLAICNAIADSNAKPGTALRETADDIGM